VMNQIMKDLIRNQRKNFQMIEQLGPTITSEISIIKRNYPNK